ncbi:MAG: GSCFA domain-containing protein [Novosphingobium sp.]|nr:GSCFA domain-containing protein [Novosphingobium sp.]
MPLLVLSGNEAMVNVKANPASSWPQRGELGNRLEPLARPGFRPSFRFAAGEPIFTIGSCFARNIEKVLESEGFLIPTRDIIRADPVFGQIGHNILNNYGAPAILNEIRWALDPAHVFSEEKAFLEIYDGKFVDVHLNHALKPAPIEVVRGRRRAILNAYQALRDCRVVIITLGLAECWFDQQTGVYLNTAPRRSMIRAFPERFQLHVLSHDEVLAAMRETLALIRQYGHPDVRVILTVSPVPLGATFRQEDVMVANAYSKAVLRTVAEAITLTHDFVDYYPSYESVTLSERQHALEPDQVHPTKAAIELNTGRLVRSYVGADSLDVEAIRDSISEYPLGVIATLGERFDLVEQNPDLAVALFTAASKLNRMDVLAKTLPHVTGQVPGEEVTLARVRINLAAGNLKRTLLLLERVPQRRSLKSTYWSMRLDTMIAVDDLEGARQAARAWSEFNVRTPEPYRRLAVACAAHGLTEETEALFQTAMTLADDEPRTLLDYAEFLRAQERHDEADSILARVEPDNPLHTDRLQSLKLWKKHGAAPAVDAAPQRPAPADGAQRVALRAVTADGKPAPQGKVQRA